MIHEGIQEELKVENSDTFSDLSAKEGAEGLQAEEAVP